MPNSTKNTYKPINYCWEDIKNIRVIEKIVIYSQRLGFRTMSN